MSLNDTLRIREQLTALASATTVDEVLTICDGDDEEAVDFDDGEGGESLLGSLMTAGWRLIAGSDAGWCVVGSTGDLLSYSKGALTRGNVFDPPGA